MRGVPPVVNRAGPTALLARAVGEVLGPDQAVSTPQSLGGEDFAWYLENLPGAMGRLGTRTPGGPTYDLHRGDLHIDERAIGVGAKVLAGAVFDHVRHHSRPLSRAASATRLRGGRVTADRPFLPNR